MRPTSTRAVVIHEEVYRLDPAQGEYRIIAEEGSRWYDVQYRRGVGFGQWHPIAHTDQHEKAQGAIEHHVWARQGVQPNR